MAAAPPASSRSLTELKDALKLESAKSNVLPVLCEIESQTTVLSREDFVASKIGALIKKLSETSAHAESKEKARELMAKWKTQFSATAPAAPVQSKQVAEESAAKKMKPSQEEAEAVTTEPVKRAKAQALALPSEAKRQKIVKLLREIFSPAELEKYGAEVVQDRCIEMERELNALAPAEFATKYRLLKTQLPKNEELKRFVLEGDMECSELVAMSSEEMMPALERAASEKSLHNYSEAKRSDWAEANHEMLLANAGVKDQTGFFKCGRCQSTKTTFYQKQTRGADEPMTVFVTCLSCKNRWKTEG